MKYCKTPLSITDQIDLLEKRGLIISNKNEAANILSNISYYRLRAYTFPYQDNNDPNHPFTKSISLEDIIEIYSFDRKLRILLFDAIEKIEVSIRTQIIYQWSLNHGSHWQNSISLYRDHARANTLLKSLKSEIDREGETFIAHYKKKYTSPQEPPSWMSLEVSSFGLLSLIFLQLKKCNEKIIVTKFFGLNNIAIMENWMHCLCDVRNICAHHGRLWNRRLTTHVKFPTNPINQFLQDQSIIPYKLYPVLSVISYFQNIINPGNNFNRDLITLIDSCKLISEKNIGFTKNWRNEPFWKIK